MFAHFTTQELELLNYFVANYVLTEDEYISLSQQMELERKIKILLYQESEGE